MAANESSRESIEHHSKGLDRAALNVYAQADRHLVAPLHQKQDVQKASKRPTEDGDLDLTSLDNLRRISDKVKTRTDKIFHPRHRKQKSTDTAAAPILAPAPSKADDDDRMYNAVPEQKGPDLKEVVKHPISSVQSALHGASGAKFANALDNQVIAHGAEVKIVRAYDDVVSAETDDARLPALEDLESLKKQRQDAFVRWTLDRHVLKIRQVPPRATAQPRKDDYKSETEEGKSGMRWLDYGHDRSARLRFYVEHYGDQYIDRNPNLPEPSQEAINTSLERLVMTSTPYQMLMMKVRHIYRWDNRRETALYLTAYAFLWAFNYLAGALQRLIPQILALIGLVLKRRLYPPTLEDIREEIKRSEDVERTAFNLTQLIEQHGAHGWVDALRQDLGPSLLLQMEDLSNVLEIWRK
ncbi:MAG: hypothetical protein Q9207_006164 [Kuettlingeria erythrocarpa]